MGKRFSERVGASKTPPSLQLEAMNDDLRTSLWNVIVDSFQRPRDRGWGEMAKALARDVLKAPTDMLPSLGSGNRKWVRERFYKLPWHGAYDLVEYIAQNFHKLEAAVGLRIYQSGSPVGSFAAFNEILERELSGYRFVGGVLTPISSPTEVAEIEQAIGQSAKSGFGGAGVQLAAALRLLGKKPDPDYRNAIKEAISAVESVSTQIGGGKPIGLKPALDKLEGQVHIHPALKAAFVKLYGYASNEDGIRHAILQDPKVGFDEAKFMIVSCSAFVNYLISKAGAAGIVGE